MQGHFFRRVGSETILHYRYMHSLLVVEAVAGGLFPVCRPSARSLAWPIHGRTRFSGSEFPNLSGLGAAGRISRNNRIRPADA